MSDPIGSGIPWSSIREGAGGLATLLSGIGLFLLNGFRSDIKELQAKVEKLEADRSDMAVMAEQIKNLAKEFTQYREAMEAHHLENRNTATADREETAKWRTEVMGPVIQKLVTDVELNKERIAQLQRQRGKRS